MLIESAEIESAETQAESYRYLRLAMVGLLLALAAAVFYQSSQQDSVLASVSAYYYTPAQAVFVGALLGLGASMIALRGMNGAENMFLNLGGMFAIVVAIVPTNRGTDFTTAVHACQQSGGTLLTHRVSKNLNCPTVSTLADSTKTNVENNMVALLSVGFLALVLAGFFLLKNRTAKRWVLTGFLAASLVWLCGLIALVTSVDWLASNGHYIAASGLLVSILVVAGSNTYRRRDSAASGGRAVVQALSGLAGFMLAVSAVLIVLWLTNAISLFLVEISVAFLFVLFWTVQTVQLENEARPAADRENQQPNADMI